MARTAEQNPQEQGNDEDRRISYVKGVENKNEIEWAFTKEEFRRRYELDAEFLYRMIDAEFVRREDEARELAERILELEEQLETRKTQAQELMDERDDIQHALTRIVIRNEAGGSPALQTKITIPPRS